MIQVTRSARDGACGHLRAVVEARYDQPCREGAATADFEIVGFRRKKLSDLGEKLRGQPHTGFAMGPALSNALKELDAKAQTRSLLAAEHFREFCAKLQVDICYGPSTSSRVTASWQHEDGRALERILFHARHNDLIVVGRAKAANGLPADFLEQLLMGCGRPVSAHRGFGTQADARWHDHGVLEGDP